MDRAATGDRLDDLGLEAGVAQEVGDGAGRQQLAVGRAGSGGLTDRIRMRSRSVATSSSCARAQASGGDGARRGVGRPASPLDREGDQQPDDEAGEDQGGHHRDEEATVVAVLGEALGRVGIGRRR